MNQTPDQNQQQNQQQAQQHTQRQGEGQGTSQQLAGQQNLENLDTPAAGGRASTQQGAGGQAATTRGSGGTESTDVQRTAQQGGAILIPPVDVIEDAGGITLLADLPGVTKDGLHLRLETSSLTIEGELKLDLPQQMDSRYAEVKHQYYQRSFALSRDLDAEQAVAELNNGVLTLRIPKASHAQPRKIEIKVA